MNVRGSVGGFGSVWVAKSSDSSAALMISLRRKSDITSVCPMVSNP